MDSNSFGAFCQSAAYISTFDILNIPLLANRETPQELSSNVSWLAISNITTYLASPASILINNYTYEAITALPLAKPLAIQCPIPACVFPISGYFTFLQRVLLYFNIIIASCALHIPLLRGVAQIWLTTFWFSVLVMFVATSLTTKVPMIYNLDFQPAVLVTHVGFLPTLLWFSFRAEPGEERHAVRGGENPNHADPPDEGEDLDAAERLGIVAKCKNQVRKLKKSLKKAITEYPVTRCLVLAYAVFGLGNIIFANEVQNTGGFWPKATAVILSNDTDYLLTSPCYADQSGNVGLWPPAPSGYNGIRNLSTLAMYNPPPGSTAVDALQAASRVAITTMHVGSVLLCFTIFTLSFYRLSDLERGLREKYLRPTCSGTCLTRTGFRPSRRNKRIIHYVVIFPFVFPLFVAVAITVFLIVRFELNAWHAHLPENEAYTEIGQWGPYVVGIIVFAATLTARIKGWDFDTQDAGGEERGFAWLNTEIPPDDENEQAQLDQLLAEHGQAIDLAPWHDP